MSDDAYRLAVRGAMFIGPAVTLANAGALATLSKYTIPFFQTINREHSTRSALLQIRAFFKSGQYVFPSLGYVGMVSFALCAYALPEHRTAYIVGFLGNFSLFPFTVGVMLPLANGRLIELHEKAAKGGFEGEKGNREVDGLLSSFARLNVMRAALVAVGGLVSLYTLMPQ